MPGKLRFLRLTLKDEITEDLPSFSLLARKGQTDLYSLLCLLDSATRHRRVRGLILVVKNLWAGWAQVEELRTAVGRFREKGKTVFTFLEQPDNKNLYLASAGHRIYIPPSTTTELLGLRAEVFFFKQLLEFLGVQPELYSLGDYKSAAEIFLRERMSPPHREMIDAILEDLQQRLKTGLAESRSVSPETVQEWIDHGPYTARKSVELGLVDATCYEDELEGFLRELHPGIRELPSGKLRRREGFFRRLLTFRRPQIAYLVAEGLIHPGESRRGRGKRPVLGAETLASFLRDARKRKRVKAVVLRINSPGGSALASDLLWRETQRAAREKPVVISLGDLAASGGYYLAVGGSSILANSNTLTGSIGVISGKFNISGLLQHLGITTEVVEKGTHAGYHSMTRSFLPDEVETVQAQMREFYEELFLRKVAHHRGKDVEEIRQSAGGRVWTGSQACTRGLIDEIGGVLAAFELARRKAGLPDSARIRIRRYTRKKDWKDLLGLPFAGGSLRERFLALMAEGWEIR